MAEQEGTVAALVYSYLQTTDPKVAENFKKKTNAVSCRIVLEHCRVNFLSLLKV